MNETLKVEYGKDCTTNAHEIRIQRKRQHRWQDKRDGMSLV